MPTLRALALASMVRSVASVTGSWFFSGALLPDTSLDTMPIGYFGGNAAPRLQAYRIIRVTRR